jgi:hypothetical protein
VRRVVGDGALAGLAEVEVWALCALVANADHAAPAAVAGDAAVLHRLAAAAAAAAVGGNLLLWRGAITARLADGLGHLLRDPRDQGLNLLHSGGRRRDCGRDRGRRRGRG